MLFVFMRKKIFVHIFISKLENVTSNSSLVKLRLRIITFYIKSSTQVSSVSFCFNYLKSEFLFLTEVARALVRYLIQ